MSKQKITISDTSQMLVPPAVRASANVAGARALEPEVVALEIDDDDFGGDPYNHTGSFCAPKFDTDD